MRCIDVHEGYSESHQTITVNSPTNAVDINAIQSQLATLKDEQNFGQIISLATAFVQSIGDEMSDADRDTQNNMLDTVNFSSFYHY